MSRLDIMRQYLLIEVASAVIVIIFLLGDLPFKAPVTVVCSAIAAYACFRVLAE